MKTLASCNPREFFVQSNRIRKSVEDWLNLTKIMSIRKNLPKIPEGASDEERREIAARQMNENARAMLDAILDEHPNETADLLGLLCFVEPEDLENHRMTEFLGAITEMINCPEVIDFFISLAKLGSGSGSAAARA